MVRAEQATSGRAVAPASSAGTRSEVLGVGVGAGVVYALTRSAVPALTHDSLTYLLAIERGGERLYHPHHLAYNAVAAVWVDALGAVGLVGDSLSARLPAVALLNSVFGGCTAALAYALLRSRAGLPRSLALAGTAGAGLSFGLWSYSGNIEVYVLPLALLLAALHVLMAPEVSHRQVMAVGALHGLAVLGHQVHGLFAVVVVVALARRGAATRSNLVGYLGPLVLVVGAAYGLVLGLVVHPGSPRVAADWFTAYAQEPSYWYEPGPSTVPAAAFGWGRSVVGGHFVFRLDGVADRMADAFPGQSLSDERFLVRGLDLPVVVGLVVLTVVAAGLLGGVLGQGVRSRRHLPPEAARLVAPLVAWVATYAVVFLFWQPWNAEFWIPQATAVWLLAAVLSAPAARSGRESHGEARGQGETEAQGEMEGRGETGGQGEAQGAGGSARPRAPRAGAALAVAAGLVGVVNLVGSVLPALDDGNDVYARQYRALAEVAGRGDAVVVDRPHLGVGYTRLHTDATPIPASPFATEIAGERPGGGFSPARVVARAERTLGAGHAVAVAPELLTDPSTPEASSTAEALRRRYGLRWRRVQTTDGVVWLVVRGG